MVSTHMVGMGLPTNEEATKPAREIIEKVSNAREGHHILLDGMRTR